MPHGSREIKAADGFFSPRVAWRTAASRCARLRIDRRGMRHTDIATNDGSHWWAVLDSAAMPPTSNARAICGSMSAGVRAQRRERHADEANAFPQRKLGREQLRADRRQGRVVRNRRDAGSTAGDDLEVRKLHFERHRLSPDAGGLAIVPYLIDQRTKLGSNVIKARQVPRERVLRSTDLRMRFGIPVAGPTTRTMR